MDMYTTRRSTPTPQDLNALIESATCSICLDELTGGISLEAKGGGVNLAGLDADCMATHIEKTRQEFEEVRHPLLGIGLKPPFEFSAAPGAILTHALDQKVSKLNDRMRIVNASRPVARPYPGPLTLRETLTAWYHAFRVTVASAASGGALGSFASHGDFRCSVLGIGVGALVGCAVEDYGPRVSDWLRQ